MKKNKRKVPIEHEEIVKRFARRLKELRFERGMTQADLAEASRVTDTYISRLEKGGVAPGIDLAEKLAKALGADITEMFPKSDTSDALVVPRDHAKKLFDILVKSTDERLFCLLNPFLALLVESYGKRE